MEQQVQAAAVAAAQTVAAAGAALGVQRAVAMAVARRVASSAGAIVTTRGSGEHGVATPVSAAGEFPG